MVMARRKGRKGRRSRRSRGNARAAPLDRALNAWMFLHEDRGIVATDLELNITHWNPWLAMRSGRPEEQAVGRPLFEVFPDLSARMGAWYRGALSGQVFVISQRIHGHLLPLPAEGGRWATMPQSGRIAPLTVGGEIAGTITVVQDVSDRLAREEELRRLNRELESTVAERTRALGLSTRELEVMMYSVAHDLRSPIRTIRSFTELVLRESALDEGSRGKLERVALAASRMSQLIDELLDAARLTQRPLRSEACDLSAMARELLAGFAAEEPRREVAVRVQPGLQVTGDSELLRRAMENLLSNAWKFTAGKPSASIEFGARPGAETVFFVRDNGAGFDMAHASQLFGLFTRLHSQSDFAGSGIGLAVVQRVVERHGGRVWAEGHVGAGAAFYFTLGPDRPDNAILSS